MSWILFLSSSLYAQDSLTFSFDEAKTLLKYAEKGYLCDSLVVAYEEKIENFEQIVAIKNDEIEMSGRLIESLLVETDKLRRQVKWLKLGCGVLTGGLIVFVIL